ncbi:MAG: SH3 domain-containing protein [Capnocytophaga felis]|nr:SH3 domain-containing protein [Capnocytophaga felis]
MIRFLILGMLFLSSASFNEALAQTYTTESKSCGSCGKQVSNNSRVGMTCPHCGVRWGYENETKRTSYQNTYNYDYNKTSGMTASSVVNLRSKPSTKSTIITKVPAFTTVSIISKTGSWYYVSFELWENYSSKTYKGYIHSSLIY